MGETELSGSRWWSPWRHLREHHPDVDVYEIDMPGGWMGCTDHAKGTIWIASGLTQAERRCTLAHELGHLARGPVPTDPALAATEERAVDEWAAKRLLPVCALVKAFQWSSYLDEIAEELWVDLRMLRVRLRTLSDTEQDAIMEAIRRRLAA